MAWASTYPAAKTALVNLWDAALSITVLAGPTVGQGYPGPGVLTVGYQDALAPDVGSGLLTTEGFGVEPNRETYVINCLITATNGDIDMAAAEAQAFAILGAAGGALATNHNLSGLVLLAKLDTFRLAEYQDPDGATARLVFTVAVDAYTTL